MSESDAPALDVLVLNAGSSSLKYGLYRVDAVGVEPLLEGEADRVGEASQAASGTVSHGGAGAGAPLAQAVDRVAALLAERGRSAPALVGHRIVHGGPRIRMHCRIDDAVRSELHQAAALAPLHVPPALEVLARAVEHFPGAAQIACLDTAFHRGLPDRARIFPLPMSLRAEGIERYGFHGLSCESIVQQCAGALPERLIVAHLGSGASVTAIRHGLSIDTSMGLTPNAGMPMATRCGDLDPGLFVYLMREHGLDAAALEDLLDRQSGLLGISALAGDMRRLHEASATNADARLAVEIFCHGAARQIAVMMVALEGADRLVFTGGIGENDAVVRASVCARLAWAGVALDPRRHAAGRGRVSANRSPCAVHVLPSKENERIARHAWDLR